MEYLQKLLKERVDFLKVFIERDEKELDELRETCEELSSRIKAEGAEFKELTAVMK